MAKQWGSLCPEGHGLLLGREDWTRQGVIWCSSSEHGGNGRFYRLSEVSEGWFDPSAPRVKPAPAKPVEQVKENEMAKATDTPNRSRTSTRQKAEPEKPAPRTRRAMPSKAALARAPKPCLCGCGGMTKGGRFLPGHDAKYHSALNKAASAK